MKNMNRALNGPWLESGKCHDQRNIYTRIADNVVRSFKIVENDARPFEVDDMFL